jgi:hypothetical protein
MKTMERNGHLPALKGQKTRIRNRRKRGWAAFGSGLFLGGIIPALTFGIAHWQVQESPMLWLAVAGGLGYSAPMVAEWFARYAGGFKAWGFVGMLEIALTFTDMVTAIPALLALVALNAWVLGKRIQND